MEHLRQGQATAMTKQRHPTHMNTAKMLMHLVLISPVNTHTFMPHTSIVLGTCVYMFVVVVEARMFTLNQNALCNWSKL